MHIVLQVTIGKLVDVLSFSVVLRLFKAGKRLEEMVGNVVLEDAIEKFSERGFARKIMEIMKIECPEIVSFLNSSSTYCTCQNYFERNISIKIQVN